MPFADVRCGIARCFQNRCHVRRSRVEILAHSAILILLNGGIVSMDPVPSRILTREKSASTRRANRAIYIELREQCSFLRYPIQIRRLGLRMTIAPKIAPTQVISQNENHVRLARLCGAQLAARDRNNKQEQNVN